MQKEYVNTGMPCASIFFPMYWEDELGEKFVQLPAVPKNFGDIEYDY